MSLRTLSVTSVSLTLLFAGCGDEASPPVPEDRSREPSAPAPCELFASTTPYCTAVNAGSGGSGGGSEGPGGAAGMGGGPSTPSEPAEPGCLIDQDLTLRCPSLVGMLSVVRGPGQSVDVLLAQQGLTGTNQQGSPDAEQLAYVAALRFDGSTAPRNDELVAPFVVRSPPERIFGLVPAATDAGTLWVSHQNEGDGASDLSVTPLFANEPAPKSLSSSAPLRASAWGLRTSQGEGVFVESNAFDGISIFRDLQGTPRVLSLPAASAVAVTSNAAGELRALVHDRMNLSILEGADLTEVGYLRPVDTGVNMPDVDLLYVERQGSEAPVVLYRDGDTDQFQVLFVDGAGQASPPAFLGRFENDCSTFYVGLTCDDCPEGLKCSTRTDEVRAAQLFAHEGRVFVAYVATDQTKHKVIDKEETGFGLGCTCTPDEVSTERTADLLVVLEVLPPVADAAPQTIERMRQTLAPAHGVQHLALLRGPSGTLDVVFGPSLARFDAALGEFPESPTEFRILRVAVAAAGL